MWLRAIRRQQAQWPGLGGESAGCAARAAPTTRPTLIRTSACTASPPPCSQPWVDQQQLGPSKRSPASHARCMGAPARCRLAARHPTPPATHPCLPAQGRGTARHERPSPRGRPGRLQDRPFHSRLQGGKALRISCVALGAYRRYSQGQAPAVQAAQQAAHPQPTACRGVPANGAALGHEQLSMPPGVPQRCVSHPLAAPCRPACKAGIPGRLGSRGPIPAPLIPCLCPRRR